MYSANTTGNDPPHDCPWYCIAMGALPSSHIGSKLADTSSPIENFATPSAKEKLH